MSKLLITVVVEDTFKDVIIKIANEVVQFDSAYDADTAYHHIKQNPTISHDRITIRYFVVML